MRYFFYGLGLCLAYSVGNVAGYKVQTMERCERAVCIYEPGVFDTVCWPALVTSTDLEFLERMHHLDMVRPDMP